MVLVLLACSLAAHGQTDRRSLSALPAEVLQTWYLLCDQRAHREVLGAGDAAFCSQVSDELVQKVFGGDFNRLLEWWRLNKFPLPSRLPDQPDSLTRTG